MTVYLGAFILADVDLVFRVDSAAAPEPQPFLMTRPVPISGRPYRKVFPSYSHKDLAIVKQAEAYGTALGDVYLRDHLAAPWSVFSCRRHNFHYRQALKDRAGSRSASREVLGLTRVPAREASRPGGLR
jgi:hypothetical protein